MIFNSRETVPADILQQMVGMGIEYTGDMANAYGRGAIVAAYGDKWGQFADMILEDGRKIPRVALAMFGTPEQRNGCAIRFILTGPVHGAPYLAQLAAAVATRQASESAARVMAERARAAAAAELAGAGIKFMRHYVTDGKVKVRCYYSAGQIYATPADVAKGAAGQLRECVTIYAKDYGRELHQIFGKLARNETDTQTDYFCKSDVRFFPGDPLYPAVLAAVKAQDEARTAQRAKRAK